MKRKLWRVLAAHGVPGFVPVLVYQMAKVGSSSIVDALNTIGMPVFHIHRMNPENLARMRARRAALGWQDTPVRPHDRLGVSLRDRVVARGRASKVITLVRDPIARNVSSYFEHLDDIWSAPNAYASTSVEDLQQGFVERFPHDEALTWFDDELHAVFGIDVYAYPFPASGSLRIDNILILKSELDDATKCAAIAEHLGLREVSLRRRNVTNHKPYGEVYRRFVDTLALDRTYVDRMLDARYTRHFYTDDEREAMRSKWAV